MKKSDKKVPKLPAFFEPKFWTLADGRLSVVREMRNRVETLRNHTNCDSYQKNLLVERATFLSIQLETMERTALEKGEFDSGKYTVMVNSLVGLLKSLGLEKQSKKVVDLDKYLEANA